MSGQPELIGNALVWLDQFGQIALGWLKSPAAWSQFGLLALAFCAARIATPRLTPIFSRALAMAEDREGVISTLRRFALRFLPLMLPLLAYGFTAGGEPVTRSLFGSGDVIAFGKRVLLFLAVRILVSQVLTDGFLRLLGRFVLVPVAALYALGLLDDISVRLEETVIALGNIRFSVMALIRGVIAGSLLFWLGSWSNRQSADFIKTRPELRPATRELAMKAAEVANDHFVTTRVINHSDQGSANRMEAVFSVSDDTDINMVPGIIETAVAALPFALAAPNGPDCELKGFGESAVDFGVEYGVSGIDGGKNKYSSPVLFAIWNALKQAGFDMPYPHRVVEIKGRLDA